ncbi:MAG: DUF11 domain-containing protein [Candidatus Peribacteraceae bacterium]|nr:DUF11 domain-containing protein [Candidatus Peribacteraceae bacterium]
MPRSVRPAPHRLIFFALCGATAAFLLAQAVGHRGPLNGLVCAGGSCDDKTMNVFPQENVCMWSADCVGQQSCTVLFNPSECEFVVPEACDARPTVTVSCGAGSSSSASIMNPGKSQWSPDDENTVDVPPGGSCGCGGNATCIFRLPSGDESPACDVSCPAGQRIIVLASDYDVQCPWSSSSSSTSASSQPSASASSSSGSAGTAELQVSITDNRTTVAPGEQLMYSITIRNVSDTDAYTPLTVSLSDTRLVSAVAVPSQSYNPLLGLVTGPSFFVPARSGVSWNFAVSIKPSAPDNAPLTALAQVNGNYGQDTTVVAKSVPDTGCVDVIVKGFQADGITPVELSDISAFAFTATPAGGGTSISLQRTERGDSWTAPVPALGQYVIDQTGPPGWTQTVPANGQNVTLSVAKSPPCATVEFRNKRVASAPTFTVAVAAEPSSMRRNGTTSVSLTVTNTSLQSAASNTLVSLELQWPLAAASSPSDGGVLPGQGGVVSWTIASLSPGQSKTVSVPVRISAAAQSLPSTAQFTAKGIVPGAVDETTVLIHSDETCVFVHKDAVAWDDSPITDDLDTFGFSFILDGVDERLADDNGNVLFGHVEPGTHTIAERSVPGWNAAGVSGVNPQDASFAVQEGECPIITFTNRKIPPALALGVAHVPAAIDRIPQSTVLPGGTVRYTVTLENNTLDGRRAEGVQVDLPLPPSLEYVGGAQETGGAFTTLPAPVVQWKGLNLPPGKTTLWFTAKAKTTVQPGTTISTVVTLVANDVPAKKISLSHPASIDVVSNAPQTGRLEIVKQLLPPADGPAPDGSAVTPPFNFQILTPGGVVLNAAVAVGMQPGSLSAPAQGSVILPNLTPGTYSVREIPMLGFEQAGPSLQTLTVGAGETPAVVVFQSRPVPGQPSFHVANTDSYETVEPGRMLTYTITVTNISTVAAPSGITVTDTLPSSLLFIPQPPTPGQPAGEYDAVNRRMIWAIPGLAPGMSAKLPLTVQVHPSTPDGTVMNNPATVSYRSQPAGFAADTTLVETLSQETGCIRIVKHSFTAFGLDLPWEPQIVFRLDGNEKLATTNNYGIGLFQKVPVGIHTLAEIVPPPTEKYEWNQVSMTPAIANVTKDTCTEVTVVNKQVLLSEQTCPDKICARWAGETCSSCRQDCGVCPVSSSSSSQSSTSSSSSTSTSSSSTSSSSRVEDPRSSSASSASSSSYSIPSSASSSSSLYGDREHIYLDRRYLRERAIGTTSLQETSANSCWIRDKNSGVQSALWGTVMFNPPFYSENPYDSEGAYPVGYVVGDPLTGERCESLIGPQRNLVACCRPRREQNQESCPMITLAQCDGQGIGLSADQFHSDSCKTLESTCMDRNNAVVDCTAPGAVPVCAVID